MNKRSGTFLGIELGSSRIKAVLIDETYAPVASGSFDWENSLTDGLWTYDLEHMWTGIQSSYAELVAEYDKKYGEAPKIDGIGVSAMMHGYLPFDKDDNPLVPFRTWRNTNTEKAAALLTDAFNFNIPLRWSVAHIYQAHLDNEPHVPQVAFLTTLAGYVHYRLTGQKVLGVGDASGMFPIDSATGGYDAQMLSKFDTLIGNMEWKMLDILPKPLAAGQSAGVLSADGARLMDPTGTLAPGIAFCPPEGDAGTGMVATNSVAVRTGNVSAGTSIFAMIVLEQPLSRLYPQIDMVTTPDGLPVAMVHCNNCTSDLDAWVRLLGESAALMGASVDKSTLYSKLYQEALAGDADCGGLYACNYLSGEPITGFAEGRPLFARLPSANFTLANFMRAHLFSALATLKIGMLILMAEEDIALDLLLGHGGLFKAGQAAQQLMASALSVPVATMPSAAEGGPWGMALLAAYAAHSANAALTLQTFLQTVFAHHQTTTVTPVPADTEGFITFMKRYISGLEIEDEAVCVLNA